MRTLVVEDDPVSAKLIDSALKSEGLNCEPAEAGEDAIDLAKHYDFDLIVLEATLPDMEGIEVVQRLRAAKVRTPVLFLAQLSDTDTKVRALAAGADDYLAKPFHKSELIARIRAIVRRSKGHSESVIRTGKLAVRLDTRSVDVDGRRLDVTGKEYSILELLSLRKGTTLTKEMFLDHLYGGIDEPEFKIVDVFICKLRKKIAAATEGAHYIETVWGRGYVLKDPVDENRQEEEIAIPLAVNGTPYVVAIDDDMPRIRRSYGGNVVYVDPAVNLSGRPSSTSTARLDHPLITRAKSLVNDGGLSRDKNRHRSGPRPQRKNYRPKRNLAIAYLLVENRLTRAQIISLNKTDFNFFASAVSVDGIARRVSRSCAFAIDEYIKSERQYDAVGDCQALFLPVGNCPKSNGRLSALAITRIKNEIHSDL